MAPPLELSSELTVSDWLGADTIDQDIPSALKAARELITAKVDVQRFDVDDPPEALHRWVTMTAARLHRRQRSIFGGDVFGLGGEAGGVLTHDPTLRELVRPYLKPAIGVASLTA